MSSRGWFYAAWFAGGLVGCGDVSSEGTLDVHADPLLVDLGTVRPGGDPVLVRIVNVGTADGSITELSLSGTLEEYFAVDVEAPIEIAVGAVVDIPLTVLEIPPPEVPDPLLLLTAVVTGPSVDSAGCTDVAFVQTETLEIPVHGVGPGRCDQDEDGAFDVACGGDDCNDLDEAVNPDAAETCNGQDDDCSGVADDNSPTDGTPYFADRDLDAYGRDTDTVVACAAPDGYVAQGGDCDDTDSERNPGQAEVCDGADQDCDEEVDEDVAFADWFVDGDGDGYGTGEGIFSCQPVDGRVNRGGDCDDTLPARNPGATETCDGVDQDCDGQTDEEARDAQTFWADNDADGYGDATRARTGCRRPNAFVANDDDCNDLNPQISPADAEICNGVDDDCDRQVDEAGASGGRSYFADRDGDLFGDSNSTISLCAPRAGFVTAGGDCNDQLSTVNPAAAERCNGRDDNCDGQSDINATDATPYFADRDGDLFGDASASVALCQARPGFVANDQDCRDDNPDVNPSAIEVCDGEDQDCDGLIDDSAAGATTFFADGDGDSYGDTGTALDVCGSAGDGFVEQGGDCDDRRTDVFPGAPELCDLRDNNCDGVVDDGLGSSWYRDFDGDNYGRTDRRICALSKPADYVANPGDCNDAVRTVNPGASETCNSVDDDCDGVADDNATDARTSYVDADRDSFGDDATATVSCVPATGTVAVGGDCDDADAAVSPNAAETCDAVDQDCDGLIDDGSNVCPCPVEQFGDQAYGFCTALPGTWNLADQACRRAGYSLVVIDDAEENNFLRDEIAATNRTWWIGATDTASEGLFAWVDGSPFSFTAWAPNEPNNAGDLEDCAEIRPTGQWNDNACFTLNAFICESP